MKGRRFIITEEFADRILGYLGTKPYTEVAQLIAEFGQVIKDSETMGELVPFIPKENEGKEVK